VKRVGLISVLNSNYNVVNADTYENVCSSFEEDWYWLSSDSSTETHVEQQKAETRMHGELGSVTAIVELLPQRFLCPTPPGEGIERNDD
jgi:hypothetical protein